MGWTMIHVNGEETKARIQKTPRGVKIFAPDVKIGIWCRQADIDNAELMEGVDNGNTEPAKKEEKTTNNSKD